jgi:hypothetical protein
VQTYVNPKLDASLRDGNGEHPMGAAAVKEFTSGGKLSGWSAYVKNRPTSEGGQGFYWYEVFDTSPDARPLGGQGSATCTGCHARGADFVRTPYPLQ